MAWSWLNYNSILSFIFITWLVLGSWLLVVHCLIMMMFKVMKFEILRAVIYLYKGEPNMGINFAGRVLSQVIIKLTYHVKPRGVFSISSGTIRLIRANQEFDTGNICVWNWLTICNNLLMDHQQHYWYIKNSCRAIQNTNNSIYLLNIRLSLAGRRRALPLVERGGGRAGGQ